MALRELKVCLLGDTGVGKSSIVWRFVEDSFDPNINPTIGASFMTKTVQYQNELHKFLIWDTAGQERVEEFHPLMPTRHLAARASNSEDSHRSQSEAAADDPGRDLDEEAGGPGCSCRRAVPCHWPPPHALYAKRTQRTSCLVLLEDCSRYFCLQTSVGGLWHAKGPCMSSAVYLAERSI
ncbi:ras-related protein Rab-22A isoform X2 [Arvicanthis niloticus]|uniref:ras-related protein Rab-22A isoform X2 n=1 Tax=Arvicanthis niloticus TaxID=61156 RepID=UPI001487332E|nr:ras-related protein Rab-22A isoform X2 [Arvicanthis niloticus]